MRNLVCASEYPLECEKRAYCVGGNVGRRAAKSFVRAGQSSACTVYLAWIPVNTRFSGCNVRVETCGMIFRNTVGKLPDRQFPCVRLLYDTRRPAQISA